MAASALLLSRAPPPPPPSSSFPNTKPLHAASIGTNRGLPPLRSSFLDLKPSSHPDPLSLPLQWHGPSASPYDAAILGCGPAGLRLASAASARGIRVCCIDPSPLSPWPNNYGAWVDELAPLGLTSCLDRIWPAATVFLEHGKAKHLARPYGRISRSALKTLLLESCAANGVRFQRAKALAVDHDDFSSAVSCSDGSRIAAALVVDSTGFATPFVEYAAGSKRDHGYQIEETSLVSRQMLGHGEIKKRMAARLRHLGIRVRRVIEEEKRVIRMGGPLPASPRGGGGLRRRGGDGASVDGVHGGAGAGAGAGDGGGHGRVPRIEADGSGEGAARAGVGRAVDAGEEGGEGVLQVRDGDAAGDGFGGDEGILRGVLRLGSALLAGVPVVEAGAGGAAVAGRGALQAVVGAVEDGRGDQVPASAGQDGPESRPPDGLSHRWPTDPSSILILMVCLFLMRYDVL